MRSIVVAMIAWALGTGCIDDTLAPRSIVASDRVLAVVADRPIVGPGTDVRLSVMAVDEEGEPLVHGSDGISMQWSSCVREERVLALSGAQYEPDVASAGCGGRLSIDLETDTDGSAVLPGLVTAAAVAQIPMLAEGLGLPPELIATILEQSGVPITLQVRILRDDELRVTAFKRVLLTTREGEVLGTNPDPPRFRIDERWMSASGVTEAFRCVAEDGAVPSVGAGQNIILDPEEVILDPTPEQEDETWIERYTVLSVEGRFAEQWEAAFYSWFSTDGSFDQGVTRAPADEEIWTAPTETGTYPLWLVVRDGHGGTSACRTDVEVR